MRRRSRDPAGASRAQEVSFAYQAVQTWPRRPETVTLYLAVLPADAMQNTT